MVLLQRVREPGELLPKGHGHGILHLGATDLEDAVELAPLRGERLGEALVLGEQSLHTHDHGQLDRRGVDVVGALAAIDVVDRVEELVLPPAVPENLETAVRDDLVRVHVRGGSRTALDDANAELAVQRPAHDLLADLVDHRRLLGFENPEFEVGPGSGLLDSREGDDEVGIHREGAAGDREVLERASRVDAPVCKGWDWHRPEGVGLDPRFGGRGFTGHDGPSRLWRCVVPADRR